MAERRDWDATRRAMSDPLRVRIREVLATGEKTVKQLGSDLGIEPNRLYYHLRILEHAELVTVAGTTASGRMVEKVYATTSESFANELSGEDPIDKITFFHALLDATKADLTDVIVEQARQAQAGEPRLTARLLKGVVAATLTDIDELAERVDQLLDEYANRATAAVDAGRGDELRAFPFTFAIYERPHPTDTD